MGETACQINREGALARVAIGNIMYSPRLSLIALDSTFARVKHFLETTTKPSCGRGADTWRHRVARSLRTDQAEPPCSERHRACSNVAA